MAAIKGDYRTHKHISSRAELNMLQGAAVEWKAMLQDFEAWKLEQQYADNLNR